jgi:hypothetical protein
MPLQREGCPPARRQTLPVPEELNVAKTNVARGSPTLPVRAFAKPGMARADGRRDDQTLPRRGQSGI